MKAIFIGGPLHGQMKQVESNHTQCGYSNPYGADCNQVEHITYRRSIHFGDTAIFTTGTSEVTDRLIVEVIERGLNLSPEPPLQQVVEILFRLHAGHAFFQRPEYEKKNIEFLVDLVQSYWQRQQDSKSRK